MKLVLRFDLEKLEELWFQAIIPDFFIRSFQDILEFDDRNSYRLAPIVLNKILTYGL